MKSATINHLLQKISATNLLGEKHGKARHAVRGCDEYFAIGDDLIATHKPEQSPDLPGCRARVYEAWTAKAGERFVAQEIHRRDWRCARTFLDRCTCCPCSVQSRR